MGIIPISEEFSFLIDYTYEGFNISTLCHPSCLKELFLVCSQGSPEHGSTVSLTCRMIWVGMYLRVHLVPAPRHEQECHHWIRLPRTSSNLVLNTFRYGASTASLGNLFQCLSILIAKNFLLTSDLNLPSFRWKTFPLVLSLTAHIISPGMILPAAF